MTTYDSNPSLAEMVVHWVQRLEANDMTEAEREELREWVGKDAAHKEALKSGTALWNVFDLDDQPDRLLALRRAALADFERPKLLANLYAQQSSNRIRVALMGGVAACLALGCVLAYEPLTTQTYQTAPEERRVISLADGSHLTLDGGTEVKVRLAGNQRRLWLVAGRAKFAVAKDPLKPFTVRTDNKTVVATGTEFSVERLNTELRVILYEGHVSVLSKAPRHGMLDLATKPEITLANLEPQQQLIARTDSDTAQIRPLKEAEITDTQAWDNGLLVFDMEPLPIALERVNRYSLQKVVVQNPKNKTVLVSGVYKAGDSRAFVETVTSLYHLGYRVDGDAYILTVK